MARGLLPLLPGPSFWGWGEAGSGVTEDPSSVHALEGRPAAGDQRSRETTQHPSFPPRLPCGACSGGYPDTGDASNPGPPNLSGSQRLLQLLLLLADLLLQFLEHGAARVGGSSACPRPQVGREPVQVPGRPRRPRLLPYTRDGGGRTSPPPPPPPRARGRIGALALRVSASPPPRLLLPGARGCTRPPMQPRRRRQRQQVNGAPRAPARSTWSSAGRPTEGRRGHGPCGRRHMRAGPSRRQVRAPHGCSPACSVGAGEGSAGEGRRAQPAWQAHRGGARGMCRKGRGERVECAGRGEWGPTRCAP